MTKAFVYFALIIFFVNLFGSEISKLVHEADHLFQQVETHGHHHHDHHHDNTSHRHGDHEHTHVTAAHNHSNTSHEHNTMITLMLSVFDVEFKTQSPSDTLFFSVLEMILYGDIVKVPTIDGIYVYKPMSYTFTAQCYINISPTINIPPPREIV